MIFLQPVKRVGAQIVENFGAAVVVNLGSPVFVLALARIGVFVQMGAVKFAQAVPVLRKMGGNPVHDHRDPRLMELVDQITQVVRRAEAAGRRKHADHLIPPGSVKRMFGQRQKLDMGKAHVGHIGYQRVRHFAISQILAAVFAFAPPGTGMHFVNRHRPRKAVVAVGMRHPFLVVPAVMVQVIDDRRVMRTFFGIKADRVGFGENIVLLRFDFVFVNFALAQTGDENVPHAAGRIFAHDAGAAVPVVEIADHRNAFGVRRPDGEADAFDAVLFANVSAQFPVHFQMAALA